MARIRVLRNNDGNAVTFRGSSNPVYWNACLSAEVDSNDPSLINVVNDIRTAETGVKEYEFFNIPFSDFEDKNGVGFATAQECADYITSECHVIDTSTQLSPNGQLYVDAVNGSDNPFADGTINRPFLTIQNAYNNAADGDTLLISKGTYTETVSLSGTKGVTFRGAGQDDVIIQAGSGFSAGKDSNVFQLSESAVGKSFKFSGMTIKNGKFGIMASGSTASIYVQDCTFQTLGWSAGGVSLRNPASGSTLGYDSPASGLQSFASGVNVSDGGAIYALSSSFVSFLDNRVRYNNDGIRLEDCSQGFVSRNQVHDNLTTGLDLSSSTDDAGGGSESVVAYNNFFAYNGANGIACEGGMKNTFALNEIEGNWNAGVVINHASEATIRDSKLVDNNKSSVNALGEQGLADASVHVAGGTIKSEAKFLAHILDTQILNSNVGANTTRVGICLDSNLDGINNRLTGQISVDDVLFADQDNSIVVNCSLDKIRLTIGDCHYIDSTNKNVVVNGEGMYHEFPFSNHLTNMNSVDFTYDAVAESVNVLDGQDGDVVNTYHINQLRAEEHDGQLRVFLRSTKKVQLEGVEPGSVYVNGASAGSTINQIVNTLNALFTKAAGSSETGNEVNPVNTSGTLVTNNTSSNVFDPVGSGDFAKTGSYIGAIWSDETIDQVGEHYTFLIENEGVIGFGVRDTSATGNYASGALENRTNKGYGQMFSLWFHPTPNGPWTIYGENTGYSMLEGWSSSDSTRRFSTSAEGLAWVAGDPVKIKVGIGDTGHLYVSYWNSTHSEYIDMVRTNYQLQESKDYGLVVSLGDNNVVAYDARVHLAEESAPALNFRYIESPDGSFYYPLFNTEEQAQYVHENLSTIFPSLSLVDAAEGSGVGIANTFVDEPTNTTWYMPSGHQVQASGSAPAGNQLPSGYTYTEITTEADNLHVPASFTGSDYTFAENASVNIQLVPMDFSAYTTTVTGLPTELSFDGFSITGTTSYVPADTDYTVTVTRTNSYGSSVGTFTLTIEDDANTGDLAGFTEVGGNFVSPNRILLTHDALLQYDTVLSEGQQLTYSYAGQIPPSIGILSSDGVAAVSGFDSTTDTLGTTGTSSTDMGNNFAWRGQWALRYVTFGGYIGGSSEKFNLVGWQDNSTQTDPEGTNSNAEFKLSYEVDTVHGSNHHFVLYRNDVEILRSADHYSGDQTITLAAFDNQQQTDVYIPANWNISNIGAGSTTPPAGFNDPLVEGIMDSTTVMGGSGSAAVELTQTLDVNHRLIIPEAWVEANVYAHNTHSTEYPNRKAYIGIPKTTANFANGTDLHNDFDAVTRWETEDTYIRLSQSVGNSTNANLANINSLTDAYYNYAIDWDGTNLSVIAHSNLNELQTTPMSNSGVFDRVFVYENYTAQSGSLPVYLATKEAGYVGLSTSNLSFIRSPWDTTSTILYGEHSTGHGEFGNVSSSEFDVAGQHAPDSLIYNHPTINAGQTYTYIYDPSLESTDFLEFRLASDNTTVWTSGITTFDNTATGNPNNTVGSDGYKGLTFAVPSDVPPLTVYHYNSYQSGSYDGGRSANIAGSTYTAAVSGVTIEGPSGNFTGNVINSSSNGWISLSETLSAGERLVLDSAFIQDLNSALPDHCIFWVGLKANGWTNTTFPTSSFFGGTALRFYNTGSGSEPGIRMLGYADGGTTSQAYSASLANSSAFLEITNTGNNVRVGHTHSSSYDAATTAFADWDGNSKVQTGDKGYGITSLEVAIYWQALGSNTVGFDISDVDWTGLSEISIPQPAATTTTNWTEALSFGGSSERTQMVSTSSSHNPVMMALGATVSAHTSFTDGSYTSNRADSRPWATACVFSSDNNSSNQHIWNVGEGAGSTDDNIYLRVDASRNLYFGWGRQGALNECSLGTLAAGTGNWYGIYIAHTGERLSGSNATAANLAKCFHIRGINLSTGVVGSEISTSTNWITTGGRMDRTVLGATNVGGRGANRSFHGKVASMVCTTLKQGVLMPTDAEISMMVRDPQQWLTSYKVGNSYRLPAGGANYNNFQRNSSGPAYATQVWLMGDGPSDAYAQIRNDVYPSIQNVYPLNMISMTSSDIVSVNIPGLT